jgi:hypothetical protein
LAGAIGHFLIGLDHRLTMYRSSWWCGRR